MPANDKMKVYGPGTVISKKNICISLYGMGHLMKRTKGKYNKECTKYINLLS